MNKLINKLPFELHIPGYKFCGPGTRLEDRLKRGDSPVNKLDEACMEHDLAYSENKNLSDRHLADEVLSKKAWKRAKDSSASFGERAAATAITGIMKTKRIIGAGCKCNKRKKAKKITVAGNKKSTKQMALRKVVDHVKRESSKSSINPVTDAMLIARKAVKQAGGQKRVNVPRILPVPKIGGALPLIPIFAALSAAGALSGGLANIVKAVNETSIASKQLKENNRHNRVMENVALGNGLYLKPYRKGLGLHINSKN